MNRTKESPKISPQCATTINIIQNWSRKLNTLRMNWARIDWKWNPKKRRKRERGREENTYSQRSWSSSSRRCWPSLTFEIHWSKSISHFFFCFSLFSSLPSALSNKNTQNKRRRRKHSLSLFFLLLTTIFPPVNKNNSHTLLAILT